MIQHRILKAFRVAAALAVLFLLAGSGGIQAAGNQGAQSVAMHNGYEVVSGEVLVKYRDPTLAGEAALEMDADHDEEIGGVATRRIHSRRYDTATLLAMLTKRADVEYAEPNYIVHAFQVVPNDTYFGLQWGLDNTGQTIQGPTASGGTVAVKGTTNADIRATQAWVTTTGSPQNVVAVIDTGIDYTHPDLSPNVWRAPASFVVTIGGKSINCAQGTHGFNAITNLCDPMDDQGHGTHVSGTIGAFSSKSVGTNAGVVGVNWTASIMGVKFLDATGSGSTSDAVNAIEFAIQVKNKFGSSGGNIRVLSNSWGGGGFSQALSDEIAKAYASDMLFVAAAGNAGTNNDVTASYPSNYANVVAVAATDNKDGLAWFSNYGAKTVALGAPGVDIASTYPGNQYAYMSGTSMATPHVSGAAALVLAACPNLNVVSMRDAILSGMDPITSGNAIAGGRLNAANAVAYAVTNCAATTPPPTTPPLPDFSISATPFSASVSRSGGNPATYLVKVTPSVNSTTGTVRFKVAGLPSGAKASFTTPTTVSGNVSSTMTVTVSSSTRTGTSTLTITGTGTNAGGSLSKTAMVSLKVTR